MKRFLKKSLAFILALTLVFGAAPLAGFVGIELPSLKDFFTEKAEAATYGNLTYEISNGKVTITDCNTSASGDLVIPETIEGCPVTSIGGSAFFFCTGLTSVTIPDSVIIIGSGGFSNCTGLTSVTIPDSVTIIGYSAFSHCTGLTSVTIPDSVTSIGDLAFNNCTGLTSVTIGNSVKSIGESAFECCTRLKSVTIGSGTTSIGDWAFKDCMGLTSVTMGNGVTSIGNYAFQRCYKLTSIIIPDSVTSIGEDAFYKCTGLTSVTIPDSVTSIGYGAFSDCTGLASVNYNGDIAKWCSISFNGYDSNPVCYAKNLYIDGRKIEGELVIPDGVTSIGNYAFYKCTGLTSVTIGNGVTSIGEDAFYKCTGLTSVTIGNGVTSIGEDAFYKCTGLASVNYNGDIAGWCSISFNGYDSNPVCYAKNLYIDGRKIEGELVIPNGAESIGDWAFYECTGLTSVTIPDSVTSIGYRAFYGCTGLTSVTIGNGVTSIGDSAFFDCTGLTSVTIGNGVTSIGNYAFYKCTGLTGVTIPDSVTSIGEYAFYNCTGLTNVTIPDSVTSIGDYAFYKCTGLTGVTIGNGVTSIGNYAFYKCTGLTGVTIPDSVTSIGSGAFSDCTGLTSITIGNGVMSIGYRAFYGCTGLTSVTIGNSVTSIGGSAFSGCAGLTSITIPNSVTSISSCAFSECTGLTSVTIPDSVTSIGNSAFYRCTGLTSVTIGNGVTSIGEDAFSHCTGMTNVTIPNGVTSIGDWAFSCCDGLTSIIIPDSVTSIGDWAFSDCDGLTSITIPNSVTSISSCAFSECTGLTSVTIPDSVTSIGNSAFYRCTGLTSVTIPDSVTSIGNFAFSYCTGLTNVTIPDSVTSIGYGAFKYCTGLTSIAIPDSVTSIGKDAFYKCTGLTSITVDANNLNYSSDEYGVLFNKDKTELIRYPAGRTDTEYTIPDSVTSVGEDAFSDCTGLTSITIPNSVTSIGDGAFKCCDGLRNVIIPNSVTSVGEDAFYHCTGMTSVTIPDSVTSIGDWAFGDCTGLTSVTIPDSVTSIGDWAFYKCTSLKDVYYAGTEEEWKSISIGTDNECLTNATIHYNSAPAGSSDELKLNRETLTISNNVCPVITVTEYPEGVKAEDLVWSSSNSEVASINSENVVTPNHYGKTEIKVETKDGKYSATCELTVEASFVITSDSSSVKSIRRGDTAEYRIYFYNCEAEELPVDEVELSIIDGGALQLISYGIINNYLYVNIKGVSEGAGVIEVYSDNPLAYNKFKISVYPENIDWRADKVPNYTKKNTENFRRSSFIVENYNYIYDENTETYTVSMDVYNMAGDYPVLAAYNSSGKMVDFDVAERFVEMPGDWESFFGTLGFGAVQMVTGDLFTYRAVTNSKKTTVSVKVPADGYITISNDITASPAAAIVNLGGLMIEIASLTCNLSEEDSEKNKDVTKEFVKSLKEKLPDSDEFLYDLIEKFTEKVAKKTTRDYVIGITQFSQDALYELCNEAGSSFAELAGDAFKSVLKKDVKALITKSAMEKLIKEDMVDATVLSKLKVAEMLFKAGNLLGLVDYALNALKFNNGSGITTIQFNPCGENGFVCKDTIKIVSNVIDEDTVLQHFIIKDAGKLAITKQELQIDPKDIVELHEIALIKNGNKVEGVEFKATVEMDIPKTMFAPTVKVFRIEKDGSYTKLETKVKDGKITFTTDHFSEYVISGRSIDEAVSGVSLNAEAVDIVNKQTYQLVATVSPETAPNKSLVWSSGDEKVATVDENGLVSAVSPGTAVITATTVDGGFTASCGITVLPRTFSVTWVVEGVETTSEFNEGEKIIKPDSPIKKGYAFAGWTPEVPETMPSEDISFFAVFECVSGISIKNNTGSKTISYGETLRLTAVATDIPENAKINWYVDGVKKGEGETFEVSPKNGSIEITVKIVDSNGNVLKDKSGNEIQDSEKVSVNSSLWQRIVSFFKNLFGINRTVVQTIFKGII